MENPSVSGNAAASDGAVSVDAFSAVLDAKFDSLKRQLVEESSVQLNLAVKKAKTTSKTFKKKGCQRQFDHNEEVKEKLEETSNLIESGKIQKAKDILAEGIELIEKRQKIIKIAESHGWDTVSCYISDELASDSDDDKRLSKAVREAGYKRREKERSRRGRQRATRGGSNFRAYNAATNPSQHYATKPQYQRPNTRTNYQTCWSCGQLGHFQFQCPQRAGGVSNAGNKA